MSKLLEYSTYLSTLPRQIKSTRAGITKEFTEFSRLCELEGKDLHKRDIIFAEMIFLVLNPDAGFCHCGKPTKFNTFVDGYSRTCSYKCRSESPEYRANLAKAKLEQYSDPEQKAAIEAKKIQTNMANLGVAHPMQNVDSFEKQQAACFKQRKQHKGLSMQGFEPLVYDYLTMIYGEAKVLQGTDYLKQQGMTIRWNDDDGSSHISYPDFYLPDMNSFVEVKSTYTYKVGNHKIMKCRDRLNEMGYGYIIFVVTDHRKKRHISMVMHNRRYVIDPDDGCPIAGYSPY